MKIDILIHTIPIRQTDTKPPKYELSLTVLGEKDEIDTVWGQILDIQAFKRSYFKTTRNLK